MNSKSDKRKSSGKGKGVSKKSKGDLKKCQVDFAMNEDYVSDAFKQLFSKFWKGEAADLTGSSAVGYDEPFRCCQLRNFVQDPAGLLRDLRDQLLDLEFIEKNNDLYKFEQSDDLKNASSPAVAGLHRLLTGPLLAWLRELTGIALTDTVASTCSRYQFTDGLLCHDDELEGRRIAFVLYLVPPWEQGDGGLLDLFDRDESGQPRAVVRSLVPADNTLVLFEVTPESFHQVSEVLSDDKCRLSVNGWFHGPSVARPPPHVEARPPPRPPQSVEEETVYAWINPIYLAEEMQMDIRRQFEADSQIQLEDFLLPDKYAAVTAALRELPQWQAVGPANRRRVERCRPDQLPAEAAQCLALLESEALFLVLSQLTGLTLHRLAAEPTPEEGPASSTDSADDDKDGSTAVCRTEVRRWRPGCYTLVHDHDASQREEALDARLFLGVEDWSDHLGGFTSYLARGEDTELLSVSPVPNALSLVYRDDETVHFVKYINSQAKSKPPFYDVACTYYE